MLGLGRLASFPTVMDLVLTSLLWSIVPTVCSWRLTVPNHRNAVATTQNPGLRLAIVVSHPIQHFSPWHRELAKIPGIRSRTLFCCDWGVHEYRDPGFERLVSWDLPLLEGYEHLFLPIRKRPTRLSFWTVDNPAVGSYLAEFRPDAVQVFGYTYRTMWRVRHWCRLHGIPLILCSDSSATYEPVGPKRWVKRAIVGRFYDGVDAAFCVGDNNRNYHLGFGLPTDRVFPGVIPVDAQRLRKDVGVASTARQEVRAELGIAKESFVVLFSGKFIERKRPLDLIRAGQHLSRRGRTVTSVFIGDGPLLDQMTQLANQAGQGTVRIAGFVNQSAIARYYAASDVLVVPSSFDPHPLVVTEAGVLGLPTIASDRVGCIGPTDSLRPNYNALIYPCGESEALAKRIETIFMDAKLRARMSMEATTIAEKQDATVAARLLATAVTQVVRMGPR